MDFDLKFDRVVNPMLIAALKAKMMDVQEEIKSPSTLPRITRAQSITRDFKKKSLPKNEVVPQLVDEPESSSTSFSEVSSGEVSREEN